MNYRIYVNGYENGWELYDTVQTEQQVQETIDNINKSEYGRYIIVRHNIRKNMDEVIDLGFFEREEKVKRKKKNERREKI